MGPCDIIRSGIKFGVIRALYFFIMAMVFNDLHIQRQLPKSANEITNFTHLKNA